VRDSSLIGVRTLGFSIPADQFREMSYLAREHGMSIRDYMAYLVDLHLAAMNASRTGGR
jgi:hypothetical protein